MAEAIKKNQANGPVELVPGSGGIFDVHMDGNLIFSKHDTGRFPEDNEILEKLKSFADR